ncbi:MAG: glycine cleavage system protein T, partial [Actinomycetota bacterium]|nr:glycine cleavage system protein T [Actinomycetota bacterium]
DRAVLRPHLTVTRATGEPAGEITTGTFSPTLRRGIGLALLERGIGEGEELQADVRGRSARVRVVKPPFVDSSVRDA